MITGSSSVTLPSDSGKQVRFMDTERKKESRELDNSVSDTTGQYDLRFLLWRQFCAQNGIEVDTLPSQLDNEQKDRWEEMKAQRLR
jgi:hypothetical protein